MVRTVAQLPGVMALAPLIAPMAARRVGVMVPVLPKVRVVVQRVGIVVLAALLHQLADKPEVGVDKRFVSKGKIVLILPRFTYFKLNTLE